MSSFSLPIDLPSPTRSGTSPDPKSIAQIVRREVARALAGDARNIDVRAVIDAMMRDGVIGASDLRDAETALLAEVAAGKITRDEARRILGLLIGRIGERAQAGQVKIAGGADNLDELARTLRTLKFDAEQVDKYVDAAARRVEARSVRKEMRTALADGVLSDDELASVIRTASGGGASSSLTLQDVRAMYAGLKKQLDAGAIDRAQYDKLVAQVDEALKAKLAADPSIAAEVREYVTSLTISRAHDKEPSSPESWAKILELMTSGAPVVDGRRLSDADIRAIAALMFGPDGEISDEDAAKLGVALKQARDAGVITAADFDRAVDVLNESIRRHRHGIRDVGPFDVITPKP